MERLSGTALAVLGLLALRRRSGYEIKQAIDRSTRFFWNASYGQIYPELRRLAAAGLIEGEDASRGGRARTVYGVTAEGRRRPSVVTRYTVRARPPRDASSPSISPPAASRRSSG